jgi:crotonobetainyl-CoA:carnitine CoA-transferase CaiB-like acyl-CoA transferase
MYHTGHRILVQEVHHDPEAEQAIARDAEQLRLTDPRPLPSIDAIIGLRVTVIDPRPALRPGASFGCPEPGGHRLLKNMRVVSFCHFLQGPAAAQYLADLGADVIKVEPPSGAYERKWSGAGTFVDGVSAFFLCGNRNKRSIAVDLKHPDAKAMIERLIETADVVMENFRPGVLDRLGFGYERVKALKPDIIYASGTGFGTTGPMIARPGQDLLIQAFSGLIAANGNIDERPTPVGLAPIDQHGGALMAMGIISAYVKKLETGEGTRVESSLLGASLDLQTEPLTIYLTGRVQQPDGRKLFNRNDNLASWYHEAPYGVYRCADCWMAISVGEIGKLATALGSEELKAVAGKDRYEHRDEIAEIVAAVVKDRTLDDLRPGLDAEAIWYQPVRHYDDLPDDPQIRHIGAFREIDVRSGRAVLVNHPNRYDGETLPLRHLALSIGADTRAILEDLGYGADEIKTLLEGGGLHAPPAGEEEVIA